MRVHNSTYHADGWDPWTTREASVTPLPTAIAQITELQAAAPGRWLVAEDELRSHTLPCVTRSRLTVRRG